MSEFQSLIQTETVSLGRLTCKYACESRRVNPAMRVLCVCSACLGAFARPHPVQTAPAATQTRQNKASSDSSVSGTAVGPEIRKETAINPTALGYTGSGGDTEQTHTHT